MNRVKALYRGWRHSLRGEAVCTAPRCREAWLGTGRAMRGVRRRAELLYQQLDVTAGAAAAGQAAE